MLKIYKFRRALPIIMALMASSMLFNSCNKSDDESSAVKLDSWGPSPALRGGELKFIGSNLDKVTSIILPPSIEITEFKTKTANLIVIDVPQETMEGKVLIKSSQGDIETKTILGISEPIVIEEISPATVKPGGIITITGDYLNLIQEVIFESKKSVIEFESQSRTSLEVKVPMNAQSGIIILSNGDTEPILIESEVELNVILPAITSLSPNPLKAGTSLTIVGTNLDLTEEIVFSGNNKVQKVDFISQTATQISVNVPDVSQDGKLKIIPASLVQVESAQALTMMLPTITNVSPNPAKNGSQITVTGTNLDLINNVTFGGSKTGSIQAGGSATSILVTVPMDAVNGGISFGTKANKSVTSPQEVTFVTPSITSMSPASIKTNQDLTITGINLDIVESVRFGSVNVAPLSTSETQLVVKVPSGTASGKITLVAFNEAELESVGELTILPSNVPVVTSMPTSAKPGQMIRIEGEKLDLSGEVIFPGEIAATKFGIKTATVLEVVVPTNVDKGVGKIKFLTSEGESSESPEINIQGVDPVLDVALVFFDFDGTGAKDRWWGDAGGLENEADLTINGTSYFRVNADRNGWTGLFWRNGKNNIAVDQVGTEVNNYVVKFDINILEPMTGGQLRLRFKGSSGDFWYLWAPWSESGSYKTDGWITVTIPIADFRDNNGSGINAITDMSTINEDFGMAFDAGASKVNICFDNFRFEEVE